MGICFSVQKNPRDSVGKPRVSNDEKHSIPSPVKGKANTVADVILNSQQSSGRFAVEGSKDEAFYDSQPWLESDAEDDYFSVRGDFTPAQSRGSTPVHNSFSLETLHAKSSPNVEATGISPTLAPPSQEKKMRLLELFKESFSDDGIINGETRSRDKTDQAPLRVEDEAIGDLVRESKFSNGSSLPSSRSSDVKTPNGEAKRGSSEDGILKSAQCCLPGLLLNHSSSERRKRMSPDKN